MSACTKIDFTQIPKREFAYALFVQSLPTRYKLIKKFGESQGNREFRHGIMDTLQHAYPGTSRNSAAAIYNNAKNEAVANGITPDFSRSLSEKQRNASLLANLSDQLPEMAFA